MKLTKNIFLIILSIFIFTTSFAQKQKTEPINSGFVFIDGKYIEPPYIVKVKGTYIYINDILVDTSSIHKYKNPPKRKIIKKLPDLPPDTLTVMEAANYINPKTGNRIYSDVFWYYYDKYDFRKATNLMLDYYLKVPSIKEHCIQKKPCIRLLTENGDTINITGGYKWEIKERKSKAEIKKHLNGRKKVEIDEIKERLMRQGCFFSNNKIQIHSSVVGQKRTITFVQEYIPIINNKSLSVRQKILKIKKTNIFRCSDNILIEIIKKGFKLGNINKRIQ